MIADEGARMRASLDSRIINQSGEADAYPLRRRLAYQRLLRRLGEDTAGGWVLKGGYLLEARLQSRARATKDLDLAMRTVASDDEVVALLRSALEPDPDGDHFVFTLTRSAPLATDLRGRRAWRVSVDCWLAGRSFAKLRVDIVERLDEIADATETIVIAPPLAGTALADASLLAVDVAQHAAEKFHALCLVFADGRQNTRVKDLLDIVLMIDAGLLPHPDLETRVRAVFRARDDRDPPPSLPAPPASWRADFALLADSTNAGSSDINEAFQRASAIFEGRQLPC